MKDSYLTVDKTVENETVIEKSKFICSVKQVNGEDEAKQFVASVKQKYIDATHNVYAYIADEGGFYAKFSDDGEPQGTAGMPVLDVLKNKGLYKVAVVVTRYFGGIKLGTGGLVRAYSESVIKGIEKSGVINYVYSAVLQAEVSFSVFPKIQKYLMNNACVLSTDYNADGVKIKFTVKKENEEKVKKDFLDYSSGKSVAKTLEYGFYKG